MAEQRKQEIRPRVAEQVLRALEGGIVPPVGVQHLLVGRSAEVAEILRTLEFVAQGGSDLRVWVGDFGSGKSFMLRTIEQLALAKGFACSTVDLTPSRRFYATDGKSRALYSEVIKRLKTRGAGEGRAIAAVLDGWLLPMMREFGIDPPEADPDSKAFDELRVHLLDHFASFRSQGLSYEFGICAYQYARGLATGDPEIKMHALRWIAGDIPHRTEARRLLGISRVIDDDNWTGALENLCEMLAGCGLAGLVVNFDEVVNLYKLPRAATRDRNYERILHLYNECKTGGIRNLFLNLGATRATVFDERRGMASYGAIKSRFGIDLAAFDDLVDTRSTALKLRPLENEEIFTLLEKLSEIYLVAHPKTRKTEPEEIHAYMEAQLNRPGAREFLTPRAVIKDFIKLLSLVEQNPDTTVSDLIVMLFGAAPVEREKDDTDFDDMIEIF